MTSSFLSGSRTFASSFVFPEKFLFCTDTTGSIGWPRSCTTTASRWLFRDSQPCTTLDGNLSHSDFSLSRVSLSLDTVVVGEVDELEEDVGLLFFCLEGVFDVEEWELDEELADKPGTTIGTKFSVLHCSRIPFLMMCFFDRWSTSKNIRFHRKTFRATILLAYSRRLS